MPLATFWRWIVVLGGGATGSVCAICVIVAGFCFAGGGPDPRGATSERALDVGLSMMDRVLGCDFGGGRISIAILDRLTLMVCSSSSVESRGRFFRPILASCGVLSSSSSPMLLLLLPLLLLPGRTAALVLVDDLVAARPLDLLEERGEVDAIDRREIVAHVSAMDLLLCLGCWKSPIPRAGITNVLQLRSGALAMFFPPTK